MQNEAPRDSFLTLLKQAAEGDSLVKLTLGKPLDEAADCRNLFVRPVQLKAGRQLCLVYRQRTKDITKNLPPSEAVPQIDALVGTAFLDAHLYTKDKSIELRCMPDGKARLIVRDPQLHAPKLQEGHNRPKQHIIAPKSTWLQALGITNEHGAPRAEMSSKFRQIQKYAELLRQLLAESGLWPLDQAEAPALRVVDMGCGKGYLTFAVAALLGPKSEVTGIELRPELTQQCNDIAKSANEAEPGTLAKLTFQAGTIADAPLESVDVVIALHACDMATDEALFRGIGSKARLLVAAPCCQKELRPLLKPSAVLAAPLRHGIFRERQAEFVTDALRAELLEWAGYRSKVFEFISTEHTPKNLMIAAIRSEGGGDEKKAEGIRSFAAFYDIEHQRLADLLGFVLKEPSETLTAAS